MIRGLFIENGASACWKNVPYTLQELMNLVDDRLYVKYILKNRIAVIGNKNRSKVFICGYGLGKFVSLTNEFLKLMR